MSFCLPIVLDLFLEDDAEGEIAREVCGFSDQESAVGVLFGVQEGLGSVSAKKQINQTV